MKFSTSAHDIKTLVLSFHPVIAIETVEEGRVRSLLQTVTQDLKMPLFEWKITQGLVPLSSHAALPLTKSPMQLLQYLSKFRGEGVFHLKDFTQHLKDPILIRQFRDVAEQFTQTRSAIVLTDASLQVPAPIQHSIVHYNLHLPGRDELYNTITTVVQSLRRTSRIQVKLQAEDISGLLQALSGMTLNQARQAIAYAALVDGQLSKQDIERVLTHKAQLIESEGLLEYFPAEDNLYELGGFAKLKTWMQRAYIGFSDQAQSLNLTPPKGILLVGIQGCGKSLAAKAIAREWQLPILKLDAGRLYDKYIGESEKNFRKAIALAESMAPTVLWIDEIEKGFGVTSSDADGGLSRRLFGSFLTWMQEKSHHVFVVATANDLSQLPPELLRKGRFDEIFFVDLPDAQERHTILQIHLQLRKQDPQQFNLADLVAATVGFSGAEIEQAVITALYRALYLKQPLDTAMLLEEIGATVPLSTSRREDIQQLRAIAQERFVSVR